MLKNIILSTVFVTVACSTAKAQNDDAAKQHDLIGVAKSSAATDISKNPAKKWFPEAGLGLFIHWGIASVGGHQDLSWGMMAYPGIKQILPPNQYWALAERFKPQEFHPEKWLQAAKDAGFGYAVMTTRHHDGFAMWPSEFGELSTKYYLGGRDLVGEYVAACRKVGLKVGFYYSPPDWYFDRNYMSFNYASKGTPEKPHFGLNHEPIGKLPKHPADFNEKYIAYLDGQITELMTRYGKIDILWFDGSAGPKMISQDKIRALQPDIIINDRAHGKGDFHAGPEVKLPTERIKGCWEHCYSEGGAWGYLLQHDASPIEHKAARQNVQRLLVHLAKCRAWGGNVLVNFGPRPTGEMPNSFYNCMDGMKTWMAARRESLIGVQAGSYPEQANVPVTVRDKTWYAFLLPSPKDGKPDPDVLKGEGPVVLKGVKKPQRVTMLGSGESLDSQFDAGTLSIRVPQKLRSTLVDVVKVEFDVAKNQSTNGEKR